MEPSNPKGSRQIASSYILAALQSPFFPDQIALKCIKAADRGPPKQLESSQDNTNSFFDSFFEAVVRQPTDSVNNLHHGLRLEHESNKYVQPCDSIPQTLRSSPIVQNVTPSYGQSKPQPFIQCGNTKTSNNSD